MTKEGQKTHNMPNGKHSCVRIFGWFGYTPTSWQLEQDMKKRHQQAEKVRLEKPEEGIIPFKPND